jgi:hypothetical protein
LGIARFQHAYEIYECLIYILDYIKEYIVEGKVLETEIFNNKPNNIVYQNPWRKNERHQRLLQIVDLSHPSYI